MAHSRSTFSNVIPFPAPPRARAKDQLVREIADIFSSAESLSESRAEDRIADRLERVAERLERIVLNVN